jgi:hypothetical protein
MKVLFLSTLLPALLLSACVRLNFDERLPDGAIISPDAATTDHRADAAPLDAMPAPADLRQDRPVDASKAADVATPHPDSAKPDAAKPKTDAKVSDLSTSDVAKPDMTKPKPDAAKPDAAKPDSAKPDAAKPDAAKPDAAKPDAAKPDAAKPDATATPTEASIVCPVGMASFPGFCIDLDENSNLTWVAASAYCTGQGKRLCHMAEWQTACNASGKGMLNMVGDWEWLIDVYSSTDASIQMRKAGYYDCTSLSYHDSVSGAYRTRCCK